MTKQQTRSFISYFLDTVTFGGSGAGHESVSNFQNLHTAIEGILAADGQKAKVASVSFHQRMYSESVFHYLPLVVQTVGTITDTVDIAASDILDVNLDACINDVFGFQRLRNVTQVARRVPSEDASGAAGLEYGVQTTVMIPGNIIQLLNKESETERLQNLFFVGYIGCTENNQVISIKTWIEISFTGVRKKIVLR